MTSSVDHNSPRIVMLLASLPPMHMGGAEMQGMLLCKHLNDAGIATHVITYGKIWDRSTGEYKGIRFTRIRSVLNVLTDIPSLFKRRLKHSAGPTKILYENKIPAHNAMTTKIGVGTVLRYQTFYLNALFHLWIRRKKFDLIHVHMMEWPAFIGVRLGRALNKPVLIKDSTMNGIINVLRYPKGKQKQDAIARNAYLVAMTKAIRNNYLHAGVPAEKISLIPNGVSIAPSPNKGKQWSNKVIFVGNLTQQPAKGIDILLLAWKLIIKKLPSATLHIVGNGYLDAYQKFASEYGIESSVHFLGKRQQVKQLLTSSDIFVLPSRREGMSNALLEAMTCAMPIVATDISGNQDLIKNNISGLLVPPEDTEKLAAAIIFMLQNPERSMSMGREAYRTVVEKCEMKKVTDDYLRLYNKILNEI